MNKIFSLDNKHLPFWLITFALVIGLPGYTLIQDGMFMDAMLYTAVSHNEARDFGTFWFPQFSQINLAIPEVAAFHEQPPLVFWIQSLFFRLFGSSMYVERLYVFVTTVTTVYLIHLFWREIFKKKEDLKRFSWLPIFIWITTPTIFWACANNMHENTMGIFTLLAVLYMFKALQDFPSNLVRWVIAGAFIFLATLSKGFPGLFPLCVPVIYWLVTKKIDFKKALLYSSVLLFTVFGLYLIVYFIPDGRESMLVYLFKRAFQRIADAPTADYRLKSLENLFMDLLPQIGIIIIVIVIARYKKLTLKADKKTVLLFSLIGLSASAPLMLTMVQKAFYLIPCFPFFSIASGVLVLPFVAHFFSNLNNSGKRFKVFRIISIALLCVAIAIVAIMKGKTGRDEDVLHDIYTIGKIVPAQSIVTVSPEAFSIEWSLNCYLIRHFDITTSPYSIGSKYLIVSTPNDEKNMDLSSYKKLDIGLVRYSLYQLK